jgi:hypothetical protein
LLRCPQNRGKFTVAVRDLAPFGISRRSGFRAVWNFAPFGIRAVRQRTGSADGTGARPVPSRNPAALLRLRERTLRDLDEPDLGVPEALVVHVPEVLREVIVEQELTQIAGIRLLDVITP